MIPLIFVLPLLPLFMFFGKSPPSRFYAYIHDAQGGSYCE
jgi:hypothetical protein